MTNIWSTSDPFTFTLFSAFRLSAKVYYSREKNNSQLSIFRREVFHFFVLRFSLSSIWLLVKGACKSRKKNISYHWINLASTKSNVIYWSKSTFSVHKQKQVFQLHLFVLIFGSLNLNRQQFMSGSQSVKKRQRFIIYLLYFKIIRRIFQMHGNVRSLLKKDRSVAEIILAFF